ncbi:MAG: phage tail tape measure protein [Lachnospiraceae bacterium]|nr:phage tail tape measure protein [Lachnospiraceae bacterium]
MASKNEAKIKFTAETSDFTQSIKEANSELSSLRAEMKLNEAQFQNTGDSADYLQTKQELLQQALEANKDKQEALTEKLEVAKQIYGEDSAEVQNLERQLTYAKTEEQNLMAQVNDTNSAMNDQSTAAEEAGSSVDTMAEMLVSAELASKITEIAQAAYDMAQEFSEASAAVVEGTGASGEALEELNQAAQEAFGRIANADADIVGVSNVLAELNTRFGVTGEKATDMTTKVSNFAQHTGTDGVKAVDSIADITKRWGMDIDDVDGLLDDLTTANQSCQMSVDDLTGYLINNSTQFQELGYSTEEALAMLIGLSDGGANVSTVMGGLTKGVANLAGVTDDVPGAFQSAIDAIADCDNVSEALQAQVGDTGKTVEEIFGKKAAQELATNIQNGSFAVEDWTSVLQDNEGALESTTENATTMGDAWAQATNNVSLALGSTFMPAISGVVTAVAGVITHVAQAVQHSEALQAVVIAAAAAFGVLAAALLISNIISAVQKAMALLNTTMLANPIVLVVAAIAALVAGLVYAYTHCEKFREIVNNAFTVIKTVVLTALGAVKDFVVTAFNAIKTAISTAMEAAKAVITSVWNGIKTAITTVVNAIKTVITTVFNAVKTTVTTVFNAVKTTATSVWNGIKTAVTTPINAAKTAVSTAVNGIKSTATSVFNSLKASVTSIFNGIKTAITNPIQTAKSTVTSIISGIRSTVSNIFSGIKPKLHLSLPHISVSGGSAPFGIGGKGSLPHFNVTWNAAGAVFKKAAILTSRYGYQGVAEAGPEAIAPIDVLQDYVMNAVETANEAMSFNEDSLAAKIADACSKMNISLEYNNRKVARMVREV